MAPARAAVIGVGFVGAQHVDALRRIGVDVAIIASSEAGRAEATARALRVDSWTGVWETAVEADVDVVHVCVPNDLHRDVVIAALDANKHVICEKPLGMDVGEGRELATAADRTDRVTVLCHNYRFFPMAAELRARVGGGELGPVHALRGAYLQDWLLSPSATNWRVDPARGGRSRTIADIGSHWVDLAETVSNQRVTEVMADLSTVFAQRPGHEHVASFSAATDGADMVDVGTEDQAGLLLRFDGGAHGTLALSQVAAGHGNDLDLSVDGAIGSATWRQERPDELVIATGEARHSVVRAPSQVSAGVEPLVHLPAGHNEGWADALRNLLAAAYAEIGDRRTADEADAAPLPTFDDGLRHLAFVEAALCSADERRWVSIDQVLTNQPVEAVR